MPLILEFFQTDETTNKKIITKFILTKSLGKGATAYCYKGHKLNDSSNQQFAIKIYKPETSQTFYTETSLLSSIKNEAFLSIFNKGKGILYKKSKKSIDDTNSNININIQIKKVLFAVIELAENYELFDYVYYPHKGFNEKVSAEIFYKVLQGMKVLHSKKIAHCDIKPENVLIDKNFNIKLIDFGYSKINQIEEIDEPSQEENDQNFSNFLYIFQSTDIYGSPEAKHSDKNHGYDPIKHDIFSLGVFLFVIRIGMFPYSNYNMSDQNYYLLSKNKFDEYWEYFNKYNLSEEFKDLISKLLCFDPNKRLSVDEILKHKWIENNLEKNFDNNGNLIENFDDNDYFKNELKLRKETIDQIKNHNNSSK